MRYLIAETNWRMVSVAHDVSRNGTLVTRTDSPDDLAYFAKHYQADLLILDAEDAEQQLAGLFRAFPRLPIAIVTETPTQAQVTGWLEAGAATVVDAKAPAEVNVLKLEAVARRARGLARPQAVFGPLRIDLHTRKAYVLGCPVKLGPKLYETLEYMALRPGQLVTRSELLNHIYGLDDGPDPRVFDVYVCNLRSCLQASAGAVDIETVRGSGFRFVGEGIGQDIAA